MAGNLSVMTMKPEKWVPAGYLRGRAATVSPKKARLREVVGGRCRRE
jgi:hypothetical protein